MHFYTLNELQGMAGKEVYLTPRPKSEDKTPAKVVIITVKGDSNELCVRVISLDYSYWFVYGKEQLAFAKEEDNMDLFNMIGAPTINWDTLNTPTIKDNVEKKFLEYLQRVQQANTIDEVRQIIFDMKYGATMSKWMGMAVGALPVNPESGSNGSEERLSKFAEELMDKQVAAAAASEPIVHSLYIEKTNSCPLET